MIARFTAIAVLGLLLPIALGGCNNPETWRFREEVVLNTGEKMTIDRSALRNSVWPALGNGGYQSVVNQWLLGGPKQGQWEGARYGGAPISIGRISGSIIIANVGRANPLSYCNAHPAHFGVNFWKQVPGGWEEIAQDDALLDGLTANLLFELEWGDSPGAKVPLLTLQEKERRAGRPFLPPLRLRQALKGVADSCEETIENARRADEFNKAASRRASAPSGSF